MEREGQLGDHLLLSPPALPDCSCNAFGGVADDHGYYAPLGAVVVLSTAVMTSVRTGLQAVAAMGLGRVRRCWPSNFRCRPSLT